ncbi:hypothetical protein ACE1TF_05815 [Geomicrobium sp. JSM 1781026]|uniref:hypothetical protein n=1 Tax=Geomicrobium sp. JSM 1781026 TaxID=3344580 RepID=UPI0035C0344C
MNGFLNAITAICIIFIVTVFTLAASIDGFENIFPEYPVLSYILIVITVLLVYGAILNCMRLSQEDKKITVKLAVQTLIYIGILVFVMSFTMILFE